MEISNKFEKFEGFFNRIFEIYKSKGVQCDMNYNSYKVSMNYKCHLLAFCYGVSITNEPCWTMAIACEKDGFYILKDFNKCDFKKVCNSLDNAIVEITYDLKIKDIKNKLNEIDKDFE